MNRLLCYLILCATLCACGPKSTAVGSDPSRPNSKSELCEALGITVASEPLCQYGDDGELRDLLLLAFPIGIATKADVRARLGLYLISDTSNSNGSLDVYAIEETLFGARAPVTAVFAFDEADVLKNVIVEDIL